MDASHCYFCVGDTNISFGNRGDCFRHSICCVRQYYDRSIVWLWLDGDCTKDVNVSRHIVLNIADKTTDFYAIGGENILHLDFIPPNLTPENAKQKFATYLTFA
jgi:hypothetical protein